MSVTYDPITKKIDFGNVGGTTRNALPHGTLDGIISNTGMDSLTVCKIDADGANSAIGIQLKVPDGPLTLINMQKITNCMACCDQAIARLHTMAEARRGQRQRIL